LEPWHHIWRSVRAPQRPSGQFTEKHKANELESSGESFELANRRPAPNDGFAPLPARSSVVTGEQAAVYRRQFGASDGGVTYAAVLARPIVLSQTSGSLKPTAMGSDLSEPAVSSETPNRHMSGDIFGHLREKPGGTTEHARVANTCLS
jgi:hypothetical protein